MEESKKISLKNLILLMIGNMIGVGIFLYSSQIASKSSSPNIFLLYWVFGALTAIFGAISASILAINKPETGGDYAYLRNAYGRKTAFIYGFLAMMVTFPGSIAIGVSLTVQYQLGSIFGDIIQNPFLLGLKNSDFISAFIILLLVSVNLFGIEKSILVQKFVTIFPIFFLVILFLSLFINSLLNDTDFFLIDNFESSTIPFQFSSISTALVAVYWTYTGWNAPLMLGDEVKEAKKNLPLVMIVGPFFVLLIYLFFSISFLSFLPFKVLQNPEMDIFVKLVELGLGNFSNDSIYLSSKILSIVIFFIVIGNMNSTLITGSRVLFAMSKDKLFFEKFSELNNSSVPKNAILFLGIFAILQILIFQNDFKILNLSFLFLSILSVMTILSVYKIKIGTEKKIFYKISYYLAPILYSLCTGLILFFVIYEMFFNEEYFILIYSAFIILFIYFTLFLKEKYL